jgi:RNA polymerase sigma-70 factor (ECF subfamily)
VYSNCGRRKYSVLIFFRRDSSAQIVLLNRKATSANRLNRGGMVWKAQKPTRYSSSSLKDVVCRCADSCDDEAWEEFVARVGKPISLTIMRTAALWGQLSPSAVEDIVQQTYLKLWEDNCRLLRDFALQYPDAILGYLKKTAVNMTHDYFKHLHTQSAGGEAPHVSTADVDPEAGAEIDGSHEKIAFQILLDQIDVHLKRALSGPDQERDRTIFWLYFRQGMSTREIAALPTIGLGTKGVGSVIERLKHCMREQIAGPRSQAQVAQHKPESKFPPKLVIELYGVSELGTSIR